MSETLKRSFETLTEAMEALPQKTYDHCVRVASYMEILFLQACSEDEIYPNDQKVQSRLKESYSELARNIGFYHDVGKAKIAEAYHFNNPEYSREERALYEKHASDSMVLVEDLYRKEFNCKSYEENWVREAIVFHHEQWNGKGFPNHLNGKSIPFFARLLALADTMDHMFCETLSEHPFEDSMEVLRSNAEEKFDPALIPVLKHCARKLKKVFVANIAASRTIPEIKPFVSNIADRPYTLWFTPIERRKNEFPVAVEADIRFRTKKLWLYYSEAESLIRREHLRKDLGLCAMLEACDALRRFDTCGIKNEYIAVDLPARWFNHRKGAGAAILECIRDSRVDPTRICIVLGKDDFRDARKNLFNNLKVLREAGCKLMLDQMILEGVPVILPKPEPAEGAEPAQPTEGQEIQKPEIVKHDRKKENGIITIEEILEIHPDMYRVGPADAEQADNDPYVVALRQLVDSGIQIVAKDIETHGHKGFFCDLKIDTMTGKLAGESKQANDYVKTELAALDRV